MPCTIVDFFNDDLSLLLNTCSTSPRQQLSTTQSSLVPATSAGVGRVDVSVNGMSGASICFSPLSSPN